MANARNRQRINVKGGGKLWIRQLSPAASNTWIDIGYLDDNELDDKTAMVDSEDERGDYIDTKQGSRKVTWKTTLKQTGADEINLLRNADGIYYELYYDVVLANTYHQEYNMHLVKIDNSVNLKFAKATERKLQVVFSLLAPKAAFTATDTAFNVIANDPYVMNENTSTSPTYTTSSGVPTNTQASAKATAIL